MGKPWEGEGGDEEEEVRTIMGAGENPQCSGVVSEGSSWEK